MPFSRRFITLADICRAYRKAKREAFGDTNCAHGHKYAEFEKHLERNLELLLRKLNVQQPSWFNDYSFIGEATCISKSVTPVSRRGSHFTLTDPLADWKRRHEKKKAEAKFRVVIDATVAFQVVSALWLLKVGHEFDACLDSRYARGNRLRRWRPRRGSPAGSVGRLNEKCHPLFPPYYTAFGKWREDGLGAMKAELEAGRHIVAVTMDLRRFYHQIDASFLLHPAYLRTAKIVLDGDQRLFTDQLVAAIGTWNVAASKLTRKKEYGLPVGLPASGVIANVLLKEFDSAVQAIGPSYYGRYVDDIFLVLRHPGFEDSQELMEWLAKRLGKMASCSERPGKPILRLKLTYAGKSKLLFLGDKQKVFQLQGQHGLDLIGPIEDQIRRQTSEHRALPNLPDTEQAMAAGALLVSSDATLDADALRKADAVTLRRAGFAMLLSSVEQHVHYVDVASWRDVRKQFYGLATRQLLTPAGFFQFERYLPRLLGVMIGCRERYEAEAYIRQIGRLLRLLRETSSFQPAELAACCQALGGRMIEAILQTSAVEQGKVIVLPLIKLIHKVLSPKMRAISRQSTIKYQARQLFLADWARRPYGSTWLESRVRMSGQMHRPELIAIREFVEFKTLRRFRRAAMINQPFHWPAFSFPTRPISIAELTAYAPALVRDYGQLASTIQTLRGSWTASKSELRVTARSSDQPETIHMPGADRPEVPVGVTNFLTSDEDWAAAVERRPTHTLERYRRLNSLINDMLKQKPRPAYVLLPECSLPRRWARALSTKLYHNGIALIAGLEYVHGKEGIRNEALVSLPSKFPGFKANLVFLQPKLAPAWEEQKLIATISGLTLAKPAKGSFKIPVYVHGNFCFAVLICSDLTTLVNRNILQGCVDCLFVPEWNKDIETFVSLVEATTNDLHAYVVQANNRLYGDSRIRAPYKETYRRDVVRVRGGLHDYFVTDKINVEGLRKFQAHAVPIDGDKAGFKPFPVGYKRSSARGG